MTKLFFMSVIIVLLASCTSSPTSTPTTGQIEGVVVNTTTSEPVANLSLQLLMGASVTETGINFTFGETMPNTTTNNNGEFRFVNLESSSYALALNTSAGPVPILRDGSPIIIDVAAGQVIDLGTITVEQTE